MQGGWDWEHYSQISICVSFCDSAWERESNVLCACVFICVCVCACAGGCSGGREEKASGEKREMKRMSVPLRKCHTGKICRF